jgi:uncharacterized protein (TIGR03067 family)
MGLYAVVIMAAGLLTTADAPDKDLEKLQGSWVLVSLTTGDGPLATEGRLTIKDDKYEATVGDFTVKATIKLDSSKTPKHVDFTYSEGPNEGETIKGIYALDADSFKFYRPFPMAADRPEKFPTSDPAAGMLLVVYKRAKPADTTKKAELDKFQGTWTIASIMNNGQKAEEGTFRTWKMVIESDGFTGTLGESSFSGKFTLDPSKSPKAIDVLVKNANGQDEVIKGVYSLEGDTYTYCRPQNPTGDRPAAVSAPEGSGNLLVVWKREKS